MTSRDDLIRAASSALIDMRTRDGEWDAVETNIDGASVVVTLRRNSEPLACVCPDPEGDVDPSCEFCLTGGSQEDDYLDVTFTMAVDR